MAKNKRPSYRTLAEVQTTEKVVTPVDLGDTDVHRTDESELSRVDIESLDPAKVEENMASLKPEDIPRLLNGKLGEDDQWLMEKLKEAGEPKDGDFFNQWTATNENSPFTPEQIAEIAALPKDPVYNADDVVAKIKEATDVLNKPDELELTPEEAAAYMSADEVDVPAALQQHGEEILSDEERKYESGSDDVLPVEPAVAERSEDVVVEEPEFDYAAYRTQHELPDSWTDDHIDQWIVANGYNEGRTEFGVLIVDPTRKERPVSTWGVDELQAGFAKELSDVDEGKFGEMAAAYRQLVPVDAAWSSQDLIDYLVQGLEPPKTSNGAWRNDVTRARRLARDWTTQELVAWALGEIRPVGETTDVSVALELNGRLDLGCVTQNPADVITIYRRMKNNAVKVVGEQPTAATPTTLQPEPVYQEPINIPPGLNRMNADYLKLQTERYLKACAPGTPITFENGVKEQRQLDTLFRYILKLEDPVGFGSAMSYFRDFYAKHRNGLFEPTFASRFTGGLRVDGALQETHVNLLAIFHAYTDPTKASRKQIDLPFLLSKFPADRQAWLLEFFQKYC